MTQVLSKLVPISTSCIEYVHPWTDDCIDATAGLLIDATQISLRIYSAVYIVSLLMRGKVPNQKALLQTLQGILQSTAFLATNAFTYPMFLCLIRKYVGSFSFITVSYIPSFLASLAAILVERKSRRGLLCLYVSNVATETLWRMAVSRNLVRPIKHGNILVFGISTAILTYYYRSGLHNLKKDSLFNVLRFIVGNNEEYRSIDDKQASLTPSSSTTSQNNSPSSIPQNLISKIFKFIESLNIIKRHKSCPHRTDCISYSIYGGSKLFLVGIGLQIVLKLVLNIQRILSNPTALKNIFFNRDIFKLGLFLGEFSALFRFCSCLMRHIVGVDHPLNSIPAGLIAGTAFSNYPDNSIALYIMWKMLHITYNIGIEKNILPKVPGFTIILYCASTATLFHAATLEPKNLRPSYWKFLHRISGGRICQMDRKSFDVWGLETSKTMLDVMRRTKTDVLVPLG